MSYIVLLVGTFVVGYVFGVVLESYSTVAKKINELIEAVFYK
jgi:hypothetical protein